MRILEVGALTGVLLVLAGCGATGGSSGSPAPAAPAPAPPPLVQPAAPGQASRVLDSAASAMALEAGHTEADVEFMRSMIEHHRQALRLAALVPDRAAAEEIRLLARRIQLSQDDEIAFMRKWLIARGEDAPTTDAHAHHANSSAGDRMPGMFTDAEIDALAATSATEFDVMFLEYMIQHHTGALEMVRRLLATDGAAQQVELFQFATHVDSDQRIEINRMRSMLGR